MASFVVDASVGVKWLLPEPHEKEAELLLSGEHALLVPDLFYIEIANVFWKKVRSKEIGEKIALNALLALDSFALEVASSAHLYLAAFEIATKTGCTTYDCLYLALAVRENVSLITADRRLVNSLSSTQFKKHVLFIDAIK